MKNLMRFKLLFLFTIITFSATAQTKISVVSGLHVANINAEGINTELINPQSIASFTGGVLAETKLDRYLSVTSGVVYKEKGFALRESLPLNVGGINIPIGAKIEMNINTINIPLQLNYNFETTSGITPFVTAGPNISYATSGSVMTKANALFDFTLTNTPLNLASDDYNRINVEGLIGAGVKIPYGNGEILTSVLYNHSFNDLTSENFIVDAGIRNKGVTFNVGYGLRF